MTRPDQIKPPLGRVGQLLRPALLSPRRQEWDDKGKALGVLLWFVWSVSLQVAEVVIRGMVQGIALPRVGGE